MMTPMRVSVFILMMALALSAGAKHYSFVGGYPSEVSEARAKSLEQNAGVKADVKVTKVTAVKKEKKMSTKCGHCGSTSYGVGCPHSPLPNKKHRHGPGANKCIWCGSTSNGVGCPHSPTGRHEK